MTLFRKRILPAVVFVTLVYFFTKPIGSFAQSGLEQVGRLPVTSYSSEEYGGFPQVWATIQSKEGLMYFGTGQGIHEYDGVSWRSIFDRKISSGVRSFAQDEEGRIFYGGIDFGYLMTNPNGETNPISLLHLLGDQLLSSTEFRSINFLNGFLFLQNLNQLIRIELSEDFTLKSLKTWTAENSFIYSFVQNGNFYVHQYERGLYQLVADELQLVPGTEFLGKDRFRIMLPFESESGNIFLLGGFSTGFYLFDGATLTKFPTSVDRILKEEGAGSLYHAIPFHGNYLLAFTGAGIVLMSPTGEILNRFGTEQGLPSNVVTSLYLDQGQGLWATTEDGMARISIDSPIETYGKEFGINSAVYAIQKQGEEFFLGTSNGLLGFDEETKTFRSIEGIPSNQTFSLIRDGKDLIVPAGGELKVYRAGKIIPLEFPKDGSRPIASFIPKRNPNVLLVSTSTGLLLYERGLSKDFPWELKGRVPGIGPANGYFFEGKEGTIIIPGSMGKLYTVDLKEGPIESLGPESISSKEFELSNSTPYSQIDGELYIKTSEGMRMFSEQEKDFLPTDAFEEVESEIWDFNQDKSGIIWFESTSGKKIVLKRNEQGKYVKDNAPNSIAPYLSLYDFMDEDSIRWFGSPRGLVRYDAKKDQPNQKPFFTLIRRIETKTDTIPLPFYGRRKDLAPVERKENSYRFEFAAPYFEDEKKTKYQTYLEGFDPDWVDWNDNRFKEYTNLSPGTYTFHVRAMSFTGRISEEAVYSFVVLAPWYATWWAYIAYALLIGAVITGIVKWRSKTLKAENRRLEDRVKERTLALEKSLSELQSTQAQLIQSEKMASLGELTAGIAHEIQNPLNFVNNFSELTVELIEEMNEEIGKGDYEEVQAIAADVKENLTKIHHHGKRAGSIVRGMLAHSRKNSSEKEQTDLNALADECLRLSFHGLRAKDKTFQAEFKLEQDPGLPKIPVVSQDIGRVLINLINNAFYAVSEKAKKDIPGYQPIVEVSTHFKDSLVEISVMDNGLGIPKTIQDKIFQPFFTTKPAGSGTGLGLSLSYDIIKAHGGELIVESTEGTGTTFRIHLPL